MKKLPLEFKRDGFRFEQLLRYGNICLLQKRKGDWMGYEVVIIQSHGGFSINRKEFQASEYIPSSKQWGKEGWSFMDLFDAHAKYLELSKGHLRIPPIA